MKKVLIVDDETIVRVTLRSLVQWEVYGMEVAADCNNGYQALRYLREHPVDLLITDVKMPGISGIELLKSLKEENIAPISIILSGYNEFDLVREAFRLGAYDYLLKEDMNKESMERLLIGIQEKFWGGAVNFKMPENAACDEKEFRLPEDGTYGIAVIEIDDFQRQAVRFQDDLEKQMEKPMWEMVNQIPKMKRNARISAIQPGHYILLYSMTHMADYWEEITEVIRRMQFVWKNYMNLTVSVAVCAPREAKKLEQAIEEGENLLLLAPLKGRMALIREVDKGDITEKLAVSKNKYEKLLSYIYETNEAGAEQEKLLLFNAIGKEGLERAKEECLYLIALLALKFREYDDDFYQLFPEEIDYCEKIARLQTIPEMERWLSNYFTWVMEYLKQQQKGIQTDIILRAKRFIADNYSNPELSLKSVADYVGLNEKYFSTKFTQKTGNTFRDYLTLLRLEKASYLLRITDLKIYEICNQTGYNNVEHFNRMFKRMKGISPSMYRKEKQKN